MRKAHDKEMCEPYRLFVLVGHIEFPDLTPPLDGFQKVVVKSLIGDALDVQTFGLGLYPGRQDSKVQRVGDFDNFDFRFRCHCLVLFFD